MSNAQSSKKSAFNPFNWPDHLRQYRRKEPDEDGSARDVHDPHVWDDPDPSIRERITPDTVAQWLALGAGVLVFAGLALYFYPVMQPTFQNPFALGAFVLVALFIVTYLKGRQDGIQAYVDMAKSIIYYGDEIDVRLGEDKGERGNRKLFTPYVDLTYGGFNARELKKRDLPYDAEKLRSNKGDEAGELAVVDRLNVTTVSTDTDTFGKVHLTHAEDLKHDAQGRYSDRYTPMPTELDEDVVEDVNSLIDSLEHQIKKYEQQVSMLEQANEDNQKLNEELVSPQIKETLALLTMLRSAVGTRSRQSEDSISDLPDPDDILSDSGVDA